VDRTLTLAADDRRRIELTIDATGWSRCSLLRDNRRHYLGAESITTLAARFADAFADRAPRSDGEIDGRPIEWILSLSEAHCTLYLERGAAGWVLHIQSPDGKWIASAPIAISRARDWVRQLLDVRGKII